MLGKFKGFYVPGLGSREVSVATAENTRQVFCLKAKYSDCQSILDDGGKGMNCFKCLFFCASEGAQLEAFNEWHKAKGKVAYA